MIFFPFKLSVNSIFPYFDSQNFLYSISRFTLKYPDDLNPNYPNIKIYFVMSVARLYKYLKISTYLLQTFY